MSLIFFNGKYIDEAKASIPVHDRGFLYGDGVFTTILVSDGKPRFLDEHFKRIENQCKALKIHPPTLSEDQVNNLITQNKATTGLWRLKILITGGSEEDLDLRERLHGVVLMSIKPSRVKFGHPCRLCLFPDPIFTPLSKLKTLSYLERLWIKEYARTQGFDEALVCDPKGHILEGAFSNFFWMDDKGAHFPQEGESYLKGITVQFIEKELKKKGVICLHHPFKLEEIPKQAHLYICNSLSGPCPVLEIEGQPYSKGMELETGLVGSS